MLWAELIGHENAVHGEALAVLEKIVGEGGILEHARVERSRRNALRIWYDFYFHMSCWNDWERRVAHGGVRLGVTQSSKQ